MLEFSRRFLNYPLMDLILCGLFRGYNSEIHLPDTSPIIIRHREISTFVDNSLFLAPPKSDSEANLRFWPPWGFQPSESESDFGLGSGANFRFWPPWGFQLSESECILGIGSGANFRFWTTYESQRAAGAKKYGYSVAQDRIGARQTLDPPPRLRFLKIWWIFCSDPDISKKYPYELTGIGRRIGIRQNSELIG